MIRKSFAPTEPARPLSPAEVLAQLVDLAKGRSPVEADEGAPTVRDRHSSGTRGGVDSRRS